MTLEAYSELRHTHPTINNPLYIRTKKTARVSVGKVIENGPFYILVLSL